MVAYQVLNDKIHEIEQELKLLELWKKQVPDWVLDFSGNSFRNEEDFAGWLQFIFLPNLQQQKTEMHNAGECYIAPQALKYFGSDLQKGKLLQLLIELDSLQ